VVSGSARAERFIEYLHVEAGSGASGGGHAAVRFADTTYHYVYAEPGLIQSTAERNESFEYAYRVLGNRSIHVSRIAVSAEQYEALAETFARRHVTQATQLELLEAAVADQALAEYLYTRRCEPEAELAPPPAPRLRGAGYFASVRTAALLDDDAAHGEIAAHLTTTPIAELRREIEHSYGAGYLAKKARAAEQEIRALELRATPLPQIAQWKIPAIAVGFAERYESLAIAGVALDVLQHDRAPAGIAYRTLDDPSDRLDEAERSLLAVRRDRLRASLVRLASSPRHDWGYPMLVGMARLVALDASLRSGRLVVPDSFDDAASWVPVDRLLADPPVVSGLLTERRAELGAARVALSASPPDNEAVWSRLELAVSAALELEEAVARGTGSVRAYPDTMLPSRSAEVGAKSPLPDADCATLARWKASTKRAADTLHDRLREVYHYDVVSRNCVTELFRTIEAAGALLGAPASADAGLGFIPVVSARALNEAYPVAQRSTLPSYRNYWLARLRETEGRARTTLRESNTFTATLRHPDDRDDVFLFYTEDATVLRPLYGAVNAGIGAGATLAGLATLPFDGGRLLTKSVRSFVFSVPELAFVSFRKGRNGIVPRNWTQTLVGNGRRGTTAAGTVRPAAPS
jgi:hypothetical protein